jgi:hypothetical protein
MLFKEGVVVPDPKLTLLNKFVCREGEMLTFVVILSPIFKLLFAIF